MYSFVMKLKSLSRDVGQPDRFTFGLLTARLKLDLRSRIVKSKNQNFSTQYLPELSINGGR